MRPIAEFGDFTTIQAAVASKDLDFVAHVSVQNVLARIWYSKMMIDTSDFLVLILKFYFQKQLLEVLFFFLNKAFDSYSYSNSSPIYASI